MILNQVHGQIHESDSFPEPVEFGEIPVSLFDIETDGEYPFEYLLKKTDVKFTELGGRIVARIERHYRLIVYTDDASLKAEAALVGIPFYYHEDIEEIIQIEGLTHQPDGSSTALADEEIRTAGLNSRYMIKEFIMPDVQEGAIIEYRYVTNRRYIEELPDFYFSHRVPVKLAHLTIHNEDYLRYDAVDFNLDFDVNYYEQKTDTSNIPLVFTYQRPEPVSVEHWYAYNVPAIDDAAYISSIDDLRGKLKFQISEFGRPRQPLENSWEFVAAQIRRGSDNPFEIVDRLTRQVELGKEIAEKVSTPAAARDSIFHYVNSRMIFNGTNRAFHETPFDLVLEGEPADQAAINLVLLAMLRGADIDAWPVYLSGRNFGRINREFPSLYQFNQVLVASEVQEEQVLMDASFSNSRPGLIPVASYNEMGLIFKQDGFEWINIEPEHSVFDLDIELSAELSPEGDLTGTMKVITGGYPAHEIREELSTRINPAQVVRDAFFDVYTDVELENTEIRESEPGKYELELTTGFKIHGYAISFQEGLQFSPMIVGYLQRNPFDDSDRRAPITLDAPEILNVNYEITLPPGYMVDGGYQGFSTEMRGADLQEEYNFSGRTLNYTFNVHISRREFQSDEYRELRRLYDRWVFLSNNEWFVKPGTDL